MVAAEVIGTLTEAWHQGDVTEKIQDLRPKQTAIPHTQELIKKTLRAGESLLRTMYKYKACQDGILQEKRSFRNAEEIESKAEK